MQRPAASEGRILELLDHAVVVGDLSGAIVSWSPGAERLYGWERHEVLGRPIHELMAPWLAETIDRSERLVRSTSGPVTEVVSQRRRDGSSFVARIVSRSLHGDGGELSGLVAVLSDVGEEVSSAVALERSERPLRALLEHASDVALVVGRDGMLSYASPATKRVLGYEPDELIGTAASKLIHPEDLEIGRGAVLAAIETGETPTVEWRVRHVDASWRLVRGTIADHRGEPGVEGFVVNLRDVTERRRFEASLTRQALQDPLTALPNRALLSDRLDGAITRTRRSGLLLAVVYLDLDRFRAVNDSLGHEAGDRFLRIVAKRMRTAIGADPTLARFSADAFVAVIESVADIAWAIELAERVARAVTAPLRLLGSELVPSASIGVVVTAAERGTTAASLIRDADVATRHAKRRGGGRVEVFDEEMRFALLGRLSLEADLRRAIGHEELVVHYQPVVSLDGDIRGAEALVRWEHPVRGMLPPADFIEMAEETGLIGPLGESVLRAACRQAALWRSAIAPSLTMAVNVSARQLAVPEFGSLVLKVLADEQLEPSALCLEITETALEADPEVALSSLARLAGLGVRLAVDDFGTGYSSLVQLRRFPVHLLKLDRLFVAGLGRNKDDSTIVGAVVELAHSLGLRAVAEGVETEAQRRELQRFGCDLAQGFLWAKPVDAAGFEMALSHSRPLRASGAGQAG